jgi:TonB-linked SusC/RagA family outer membrane protein
MKRILFALLLAVAFLYQQAALAQSIHITGRVEAEDQSPLPGVNVLIKGSSQGVVTDSQGAFSIQSPVERPTLIFSFIGYETKEVAADGPTVNVLLVTDTKQLAEVVVVGYGSQSRRSLTGSVTSVSAAQIKDLPVPSPDQLLQGKATGVQVTSNSGVPGGGIFIRVRGTNSVNAGNDPLYVVDGVFINNTNLITTGLGNQVPSNPLADINPADIESIQVLKDANATAIYGSRGANGVVIITTKRGKAGSRSRINFSTYQGWSQANKKFEVVSGPQLAELENELYLNTGGNPATLPYPNPQNESTYDRNKDVFRTARTQDYELSFTGGNDKTTFYIGGGYFKQESIVKPSNFERYSLRLNLDHVVGKHLKIGTSNALVRTWRNVSSNDNNPVGVINSALFPRSNLPIFNADGTYAQYGNFDNHLALIDNLNNSAVGYRVINNVYGEYTIFEGLTLRSSWSIDFNDMYENNYSNPLILAGKPRGRAVSALSRDITLLNEQVLSYRKDIGDEHNIYALIGNTIQKNTFQRTTLNGQQFPSNDFQTIASAATQTGSSAQSAAGLVSYFGKVNYTFRNRYSLEASVRADASSRFGANKRWGYFPSAGLSWRLGEESFIKSLNVFDELKLRGSIGLTGNQSGINDFASLGLWQAGANYLDLPGTSPSQLANENLSWESTRQWNIGVDAGLFRNRLQVEFNYYDKYTSDLLLSVPVPRKLGYSSIFENFGAVSNKGFEVALTSTNVQNRDFSWSTSFNISRNINRIDKLASPITTGSRDIFRLQEGIPLYSFWLYRQTQVNPETGDAEYEDVNKDGQITVADRQIVGNAWPDFQGGLTNTITYKGFDFSFFFYFEQGAKIMNMNRYFLVQGGLQRNIGYLPEQLERWQKPGDVTDIPRLSHTGSGLNNYGGTVQNLSTRQLEDGSFIRLRTLTLGYTLPQSLVTRAKLSSVRFYVQGTNLLTFTKYSGLDPEVNSQSNVANTKNFDWATVPQPRTIQVGLNLSL